MGQAASKTVLAYSKHYFRAAGGLDAASVAELVLLPCCISTTFLVYLRNLLCPGVPSCLSLAAQNLFYQPGLPHANASIFPNSRDLK